MNANYLCCENWIVAACFGGLLYGCLLGYLWGRIRGEKK